MKYIGKANNNNSWWFSWNHFCGLLKFFVDSAKMY